MGDSKLCLLLLLSTSALAFAQDDDQPICPLANRYKTLHKYEYQYEAESLNAINGASQLKNGPKASCMVEIEVPQTCSFIVRTKGCTLSEVSEMDAAGNPVFRPTPSSDAFAAEMEKYPLKVVVEGLYDVKLYPEEGETTTILNVKRGIISALVVPLEEENKNKFMPTVHGVCKTYSTVNVREDIATDISLKRDLSKCDKFVPMRDYTSPLAVFTGMHYPLAQLVRSSQTCNYKFDNEKKHMISGSCTEKHMLIPFSHKGEFGVTNMGMQEMTLVQVTPHNDRVFDHGDIVKVLNLDVVDDKTVTQDKDAALTLLRELAALPETDGDRRAPLFRKLVTMIRGMKTETLTPAVPEALAVSRVLTYQVLAQCGTPECSSAIMQILRTFDNSAMEVDAAVFAMGLMSNPSAILINDMLEMAKFKASKPIMYALSNVVKRFYKAEGKIIPETSAVAEFMAAQLGDCTGDKDQTFMTLRVIGNMAPAVVPASPALRAAVMQCVSQPAASMTVQQAAIQVYRLAAVPEESREVLMQVVMDSASPVQKRIAAYLVLMKDPRESELAQLTAALPSEQDTQFKSFVISHITNILSSTEPQTMELRQKILNVLQDNEIGQTMDPSKFSRNYKMGSLEGNMIFEGSSYLPKEVMLEMTLKAFGYDVDMMEIGMEGQGFEPSVEALFGPNGFFPDTALKTMYFVSDNMPVKIGAMLKNVLPAMNRDRMKRQTSQNLIREIGRNFNKLVRDLKNAESPEAMVYLRLLGNELGYVRTNDLEEMAYSAALMIDSMLKMFPADFMKALMTQTDNTFFAHYIFMDNEFFLPTLTGFPLRFGLSGTFTPGVKGGLKIARDMSEVAFMPSAGVQFLTQIGVHLPEYVDSGLEMHTNIFHESGLTAKISMGGDRMTMTIPAPSTPTKLFKMTNNLVAVTGSEVMTIPPMVMDKVDVNECTPFFAGMKYCSSLQYTDAFSQDTAPYFPFTGDSKFVVELHPTGEVTEYTVTAAYELLREGEEGRQKVDAFKVIVRAEGADPSEARAIMKYNRRRNLLTTDILIPDYDLEVGFRAGIVDGNTKGKGTHSISLDFVNKNIPQLSLVGRANLKAMKEAMMEVQLLVPAIRAEATFTANMKREEEMELAFNSDIKIMDATSEQKIEIKYDATRVEVEFKSDMDTKTTTMPLYILVDEYLDAQVGETDMKVRHIFKKFVEASNNYMEKYGADMPYIQNFRVPDMPEMSMPERLFLNNEAKITYFFNTERFVFTIPVPLGGKSTTDFNFPPVLTTPQLSFPEYGLEVVSMEIPIPELFVPEGFTLSIPLFGKAELSTMMKSNLYNMEASMAAGKDVVQTPSYSAKFDVTGTSPIDILSVHIEGSGMLATTDSIKAEVKGSLAHKFLEASVSITEEATNVDRINVKSTSKFEAISPLGLNIALDHTGMAGVNTEELAVESNFDGMFKAGPIYGKTLSTQTLNIFPFRPEAKIDSSVQLDSTIVKAQNTITGSLLNGEISVVSNTNAFEDALTHVVELSFKDQKLAIKCDANALALGMKIRNQAEASADATEIAMRMETNADYSDNRVYSLMTGTLDVNGLAVNSDANMKFFDNEAIHKFIVRLNKDGLTTSGTTTLQSPLSLENTFSAALDYSRATLTVTNKAAMSDIKVDNTNSFALSASGIDVMSKAEAIVSEFASYTHDIVVDMKPFTVNAKVSNNLKLLAVDFSNDAKLVGELYKIDLTGTMNAIYGAEELKHTYQMTYADMTANAKCSTTGKLFGTHMNHNAELEVIGLALTITNGARFNSQPVRFDHSIRCSIVPFDFNLDAIFNADGDLTMYGQHSGQVYGKLLLRAQPLAFASSHECRASLTQRLENDFSLETTFDNKMDTTLSLDEQKTTFTMKSKLNEHAFNQDMSLYNTAERMGMEVSSTVFTNMLNSETPDNQEFTMAGFLKYDKNTNSHVIRFPLIESVPMFLESVKGLVVRMAEALQDIMTSEEVRARLEAIPERVSNFVSQMNIRGKVMQLRQLFSDVTQEFSFSMEDVEGFLGLARENVEKLLRDLSFYIENFVQMTNQIMENFTLPETIIQKIQEVCEEYDIKGMFLYLIDTVNMAIQRMDLEKLKGTSIAFLVDIDNKFNIRRYVQESLNDIKHIIERIDIYNIFVSLKEFIQHFNMFVQREFKRLMTIDIPKEMVKVVDYVKTVIQDIDIVDKINAIYAKVKEMIVKFEVDRKLQIVVEQAVELIKRFKIDETITSVVQMVKDADIPAKFMQTFQQAIDYFKATEVKDIIQHLNNFMETIVMKLKAMEYNDFVNYANQVIAGYTTYMNEMIKTLEIPQKLEATREFINLALSSLRDVIENLREVKVAEILKSVKDTFDQVVLNDAKRLAEYALQKIADLDIKAKVTSFLEFVKAFYDEVIDTIRYSVTRLVNNMKRLAPDQKIIEELGQMFTGLMIELNRVELNIPSFTLPLTDLVVPSMVFSMDRSRAIEIPNQLDIPEFTILNFYTVPATTISYMEMKQKILDLIEFIVNFRFNMIDLDAFLGDLSMNYLPAMPEIAFPEFTLPEFSFPTIPQVPVEKLVKTLEIPEIKLPTIPTEFMIPCFGKLYGEIKFLSPIYTIKTSGEFLNSTENEMTPQFTGFLSSTGASPSFEILNYKLDSTVRVAIPKMSRIVVAESLKWNLLAIGVDHQASLNIYGLSAQAQAKTGVKVTTTPYTADFTNIAFIAMEGGMSGSLETTYNHMVNLELFDVRSEASLSQKVIARQDGLQLTLTVDNTGKASFNDNEGNHKCNLQVSVTPSLTTLTFTGDTDSAMLKLKQIVNAEIGTLTYFKFNVRNEAGAPMIKNSVFVASGNANLFDMKVDINANHDTELHGAISGLLSNRLHLLARPMEFVFDFENKGNTRVNVFDTLNAKIDVQSDYSALFKPDTQKMNTATMARLNQYKVFYNFTVDNNEDEAGVFVAMEGETNLDFLKSPISIPELDFPFIDFRTPAISDLNLYEQTRLKDILTTTEQSVDVDAKVMYKKSKDAPLVDMMGLIRIPSMGDFVTEMSMKSSIINLNLNAGLYTEDDIVFRMGATTASVFEALKAKLDGTTSLTTSRGLKWANSLSLENNHVQGTHDSSVSVNPETFETAVSIATVGKIALPIVSLEANQNLVADTKTKPNALSTFRMTGDINIPLIKAIIKADADHSLKLEGTLEYLSMETSTRGNMDGTVFEDFLVFGVLDNELTMYLNENGLRSTSKVIGDAKLNRGTIKVFGMDVNENLEVEASMSRVYGVLKYTGNNEADLFDFNTKGKQIAQANFDFVPMQSLTADIDIDVSQPTNMGDITFAEKAVVEMTPAKQMVSTNTKFDSPMYTTTIVTAVEGSVPVFKVDVKSSATSFMTFLEYDMDATTTTNFENDALSMINKMTLTHADMNMDVNHVISQALRRKRQVDDSVSRHTLNVDINSPTFTDMNLRYAASRNGISASVSSPSAGFLGLQVNGRMPAQINARLYGRYPSTPEVDVDIFMLKTSPKDADKMNLQVAYNMEAPKAVLSELKMRFPSVVSTLSMFADKYEITNNMVELKNAVVTRIGEAYDAAVSYDIQMSQLSIFFRNVFVQSQKTVQVFLDALVKFLRETQFKLPGSDEFTTVPEVLQKLTGTIAAVLDKTIQSVYENMEAFYGSLVNFFSNVQVRMPIGDALNGGQIIENVKATFKTIFDEVVDFVKNMESLDTMIVKIGETFKAVVDKTQEFVDSVNSDYLDAMFVNVNNLYLSFVTVLKNVADKVSAMNMEQINHAFEYIMDMFIYAVDQFNTTVYGVLQQASVEAQAFMKVNEGRLEIDLPFAFQQ